MLLFPVVNKKNQRFLTGSRIVGAVIVASGLFLWMAGLNKILFLDSAVITLLGAALMGLSFLSSIVFSKHLLKGFLGFSGGSLYIYDQNKSMQISIPQEKISALLFKPGPTANNHPGYTRMLGLPGLLFGSYDGSGSMLEVKSPLGRMRFYIRFDTDAAQHHFINTIKTHPETHILKK